MIMKHCIVAVSNALTSKEFSYSKNRHNMKQICLFDIMSIIRLRLKCRYWTQCSKYCYVNKM